MVRDSATVGSIPRLSGVSRDCREDPAIIENRRLNGTRMPLTTSLNLHPVRNFLLALLIVSAQLIFNSQHASADIILPKLFSDHMVLQRESEVPVWGVATPGQALKVTFADVSYETKADAGGKWSTSIRTHEAGGPFELEVSAEGSDLKVGVSNVMVGDVWICSGQSNMEWPVKKALNPDTEIEQAKNFPNLRLFSIKPSSSPEPLEDFGVVEPWAVCGPDSVGDFSAVGYFFGRELSKSVGDVPIGLINSTWGGTRCEAWASRESLESVESLSPLLKHWDEQKELVTSRNHPANIFNAMVAPMTRFPIRGVIWYQGEANVGRGKQYSTLFPTMISDWRKQFGSDSMPFYFAQLAPFKYQGRGNDALPELWEAQRLTALKVPGTGMVVTSDIGNLEDIHPRNKQAVGQRFALLALRNQYFDQLNDEQKARESCGPMLESISLNGNVVRVTFTHTGNQLQVGGQGSDLVGFSVCGEDKVFHPADARIVDDVVVELTCESVSKPVAVRYGWGEGFEMNLVNDANLPASPFRSDDFPMNSDGKHF